jgi:hypothetical protein
MPDQLSFAADGTDGIRAAAMGVDRILDTGRV